DRGSNCQRAGHRRDLYGDDRLRLDDDLGPGNCALDHCSDFDLTRAIQRDVASVVDGSQIKRPCEPEDLLDIYWFTFGVPGNRSEFDLLTYLALYPGWRHFNCFDSRRCLGTRRFLPGRILSRNSQTFGDESDHKSSGRSLY